MQLKCIPLFPREKAPFFGHVSFLSSAVRWHIWLVRECYDTSVCGVIFIDDAIFLAQTADLFHFGVCFRRHVRECHERPFSSLYEVMIMGSRRKTVVKVEPTSSSQGKKPKAGGVTTRPA